MEKRAKSARPARKATTRDVLGPNPASRVDPKWREHYDRLLELRSYLRRSKRSLLRGAQQQKPRFSQHMADAGTSSFERDLALSRISSEQDALFEINEALKRIVQGTYGICELTGKPIDPERLRAIPWTRFSSEAEKQLEQQGQIKQPHLEQPSALPRTAPRNQIGEEWEAASRLPRRKKPHH